MSDPIRTNEVDFGDGVKVERTTANARAALLITGNHSLVIHIDSNPGAGVDSLYFVNKSGDNTEVFARLKSNGDLFVKGTVTENATAEQLGSWTPPS